MEEQHRNIRLPLPQGRNMDGDNVQAEEKVLPEPARLTFLLQILVGGGDDPHIRFYGLFPPQALYLLLLDGPQHLGLGGQGHIADFIQKEGPPVGHLKAALAVGNRIGKGPFLVAEEFAFDKGVRNGGAVHLHKGLGRPGSPVVDGPGHQFLPGAVLPGDEDPGIAGGGMGDKLPDPFKGGAVPDYFLLIQDSLLECPVFLP